MIRGNVLIVEDEYVIAEVLGMMIEDIGMSVCGMAMTADEAVALARQHQPDLVLMDMRLHGSKDGVDASLTIRSFSSTPIIFLTGSREESSLIRINSSQPAGLLYKPLQFEKLKQLIEAVIDQDGPSASHGT